MPATSERSIYVCQTKQTLWKCHIRLVILFVVDSTKYIFGRELKPSLGHGERQVVVSHLDLVLGLQVGHPVGAHAVYGDDDVTLHQVTLRRFASRGDLSKHRKTWHVDLTFTLRIFNRSHDRMTSATREETRLKKSCLWCKKRPT